MPSEKGTAFALSYRPKGGVNEDHELRLNQFFSKYCLNWKAIEEMVGTDGAHYHCGLILKKEVTVGNVTLMLKRWFKKLLEDSGSNPYVAIKVDRWFQGSGWDSYMMKDDDSREVSRNIDGDIQAMLWPNIPLAQRKQKVAWRLMHHYKTLWVQKYGDEKPVDSKDCLEFLNVLGYVDKVIALPKTGKELRCQAVHLHRYLTEYRGNRCIDDRVDEMRQGIVGEALTGGFNN